MVPLLVILMIVVFITADVLVRQIAKSLHERRLHKERLLALDLAVRIESTEDAKSLKRVEVKDPKARILAVDDEPVILDSFRKILVLEGYAVDTVETGQEALGLIQKNNYDFLFTDLKMPSMDGLEVTKAAKHLRPDIDVVIITGYGTIESAVSSMKYGALDYVQKPFTEDELITFINHALIRRQKRLEDQVQAKVHLVTSLAGASPSHKRVNLPAGLFIAPGHTWLSLKENGTVTVGLDDFVQKMIGPVEGILIPEAGATFKRGDPLFQIRKGGQTLSFLSPVKGQILKINKDIADDLDRVHANPTEFGWICSLEPQSLTSDLYQLKMGREAVDWYQKEIERYGALEKKVPREGSGAASHLQLFAEQFLNRTTF